MPDTWDRFVHWMNSTYVRINRVGLVISLVLVGVSIIHNDYGFWFWFAVVGAMWSLFDIVKHQASRVNVPQSRAVGPEDTPEWSNNNKQG